MDSQHLIHSKGNQDFKILQLCISSTHGISSYISIFPSGIFYISDKSDGFLMG